LLIGPLEPRNGYLSSIDSTAVHGDESGSMAYTEHLSVQKVVYQVARLGGSIRLESWPVNGPSGG
jgi:hypothetical protein